MEHTFFQNKKSSPSHYSSRGPRIRRPESGGRNVDIRGQDGLARMKTRSETATAKASTSVYIQYYRKKEANFLSRFLGRRAVLYIVYLVHVMSRHNDTASPEPSR